MERIGIYGGTFNPPHAGHIQAAKQAVTALKLDKLVIVPTSIAPHKAIPEHSPTSRQRLEMLRIAAEDLLGLHLRGGVLGGLSEGRGFGHRAEPGWRQLHLPDRIGAEGALS